MVQTENDIEKDNELQSIFLVAQPRFCSFSMYDTDGHLLYIPASKSAKQKLETDD